MFCNFGLLRTKIDKIVAKKDGIVDPDDPDNEQETRYWVFVEFERDAKRGESSRVNFTGQL